jgi:hypothetical protein
MARRLVEGSDELIDENVPLFIQRADVDLILEAGQRGLAGQGAILGSPLKKAVI